MRIPSSRVSSSDDECRVNRDVHAAVIADSQERRRPALGGGPLKAREKHLARNNLIQTLAASGLKQIQVA